jgi:ribosome-binding factor A
MKKRQRSGRLSDFLTKELSVIIRNEIRDPRVGLITITDVVVSNDNSHAKIYFTSLVDESQRKSIEEVLNNAKGFLRTRISQSLNMRSSPALRFFYDEVSERSNRINELLAAAKSYTD